MVEQGSAIAKTAVIDYFDSCAPFWDAGMVRNDAVIRRILDNAAVGEGVRVLDVACGTGVLIPDYLARKASSVTAVDISPKMIDIARQKFAVPNVRFLCCDAESADMGADFDAIVVYNAFPHFSNGAQLIARLAGLLAPGGTLAVAHGMSRAALARHHAGSARKVSVGLMPAEQLADIFQSALTVTAVISDEEMYEVCGRRDG